MGFRQRLKFGKPTLLQTLLVAFVLPLLLTGALVEYLAWKQEQRAVEDLVWQLQEAVGDRIESKIDQLTTEPVTAAFQTARAIRRGGLDPTNLTGWKAYMADLGQVFETPTFVYFGNEANDLVALHQRLDRTDQVSFRDGKRPEVVIRHDLLPGGDRVYEQITQPYLSKRRPWYRTAVDAQQATWTDPYKIFLTSGNYSKRDRLINAEGITFAVPFYREFYLEADVDSNFALDANTDKTLLGVIGVDLTFVDIDSFLSRLEISESGEAFILDREGQTIASSYSRDIPGRESRSELIQQTSTFLKTQFKDFKNVTGIDALTVEIDGQRQLLQVRSYSDSYGLDWIIAVVVPESDFLGPLREKSRIRLLVSLAILSGVLLLLLAIAQRINQSMRRLSLASQSIAEGNLAQPFIGSFVGSFIREINATETAFNQMGQKLKASHEKLEEYSKSLEAKVQERTQSLEQEIRDRTQSEATFRNLVSNIPGIVYRCSYSTEWMMEFMSDAMEEVSGYPASDFIRNRVRSYISIISPKDIATLLPVAEAAIYQRETYVLEYRIKHRDGSLRWIYDKGRGVFDDAGNLLYLDGAFFDITPLKQAEKSLQHQGEVDALLSQISRSFLEQPLDTAIDRALEQIVLLTKSGRARVFKFDSHQQFVLTHSWNRDNIKPYIEVRQHPFNNTYAWIYQQLIACKPLQFLTLDDLPPEATTSKAALAAHNIQSLLDIPIVCGGRSIGFIALDTVQQPKKWTASEVKLVKRMGEMIAIAKQKNKAECDLIQAKETAEIANRAKSEFLASMSHELRSPLNAILGFAQIMQRSPHLSDHHQDDVQIINRSGEHLLTLINNVLDMSKIEAGRTTLNPIDFDLHSLLQDIYGMFKLNAEQKQIQLVFEVPRNLPRYIRADQGKLKQVLINLLNNSIKFTQAGNITATAQANTTDASTRSLMLQFAITDTGPGIDPADCEKVFEPFTQSRSGRDSQEGTGLGLSICRKFVQLMGGEIRLRSRTDGSRGTVATFSIQAQQSTAQDRGPTSSITREIVGVAAGQSHYKILVVDDKAANRQLLVKLLKPLGLEVKTADSGKAAVDMAKDWSPDLIWMDLRMPGISGTEATRQIRALNKADLSAEKRPKIVALSATSFVRERADAIAAGCDAFIAKPFQTTEIFDCMANQLGLRYRYADDSHSTVPVKKTHHLDRQALAGLSPQLLTNLESAILRLQWNKILQLIEQISAQDPVLAESLHQTVHDFQYSQILEAIES